MTEWRTIPSSPEYEASAAGDIRRRYRAKGTVSGALVPTAMPNGYLKVRLWGDDGIRRSRWVQRLVCEAFHGPPPFKGAQAAHENGIRPDNREDNLGWSTRKDNEDQKFEHGTNRHRDNYQHAKLSTADVVDICRRYAQAPNSRSGTRKAPGSIEPIAREYGITVGYVAQVAKLYSPNPEQEVLS